MRIFILTSRMPYGVDYHDVDSLEPLETWMILTPWGNPVGRGDSEEAAWQDADSYYRNDPKSKAEKVLMLDCASEIYTGCDCGY